MRRAARASLIVTTALLATAPAAFGQLSADIGIEVPDAVWNAGQAWVAPANARVVITRPSWAGEASDHLSLGNRVVSSSGWFTPGGDWTRTWRTLAEGTYSVRVYVRTRPSCYLYFGQRHCSYATGSNATTFAVDAGPPSAPGLAAAPHPVPSGEPITWTPAHDHASGVARYEVLVDGQVRAELGAGQCASACSVSVDPGHMPDGTRQVAVRAIDAVGNAEQSAVAREVRDTPQVELLDPPAWALKGRSVVLRAAGSVPNGGDLTYEWDLDGDGEFETPTGAQPNVRARVESDVTVALRATAPGGGEATARHALDARTRPPSDDPGVTIEQGDRFTNSRRVALELSWPEGATSMRIATDGGFRGVPAQPVQSEATITLDQADDARLPHVVYVRFQGAGIDARETYTDDIILDTTPPVLQQAAAERLARGVRITTRARDALSGVGSLEVAPAPGRPVTRVAYARRASVAAASRRPVVRVVDRAGNPSRWVRARVG